MRVLLDTDVIVAAMRSPTGASAELLRCINNGHATLLMSVALGIEYEATCLRAEHRLAAGLSEGDVTTFLDGIVAMATPVTTRFRWRPQLHDPGDEMVLEAAVNGGAEAIVTFNLKDYGSTPHRFGIDLIQPGEALKRIRK